MRSLLGMMNSYFDVEAVAQQSRESGSTDAPRSRAFHNDQYLASLAIALDIACVCQGVVVWVRVDLTETIYLVARQYAAQKFGSPVH